MKQNFISLFISTSVTIIIIFLIFYHLPVNQNSSITTNKLIYCINQENIKDSILLHNHIEKHYNKVDSIIKSYNSPIKSKYLLVLSYKYNIDPYFILAQGILESHLGTTGRSKTTNSVFGVGMLDDGTSVRKYCYSNPNESIEPYLILLKERYFRHKDDYKYNHHNINHLLKSNTSYIDKYGNRYASAENYESSLRFLYKKLIRL